MESRNDHEIASKGNLDPGDVEFWSLGDGNGQ